ncbi:MAG: RecX family transcriptional regulator [Coriobacteriia bacterium]|nr:RecX family transcriptional regulator [Coriobacteriia bacterium]
MEDHLRIVTDVRGGRGRARRTVYLEGEPWMSMPVRVLRDIGIAPGDAIDTTDVLERARAAAVPLARERAYRLLGFRDRSAAELRGRLEEDSYPDDIVRDLIEDLSASGLLDDERFARTLARSLIDIRGLGRARAAREMTRRGVATQTALETLDEILDGTREDERALSAARRSRRESDTVDRLAARLVRRGFGTREALHAARTVISVDDGSADDNVAQW